MLVDRHLQSTPNLWSRIGQLDSRAHHSGHCGPAGHHCFKVVENKIKRGFKNKMAGLSGEDSESGRPRPDHSIPQLVAKRFKRR